MKALIDGDVIVYAAGFASDTNVYSVEDKTFQYKADAVKAAHEIGLPVGLIEKTIEIEPLSHCLHSVNKMIEGILEAVDADEAVIYLSGATNFRNDLVDDYKANRDTKHKPHHYEAIKAHLKSRWEAIVTDGIEADDAMGIAQWSDMDKHGYDELDADTCICTVDKDLNMIAGWHYNFRKGDLFFVDPEDADRYFFKQLLTGDTVDNIEGLKGVGDKTAEKILNRSAGTVPDLLETVVAAWLSKSKTQFAGLPDKDIIDIMATTGDLLWIQREPHQTWDIGLTLDRY